MANNLKYVIDDGKNKFAAYDAETVDSLLNEKVNNDAFNSAVEELEGEINQKANTEYVNEEIARIETIIEDLPEPMIFKGTLGTGGTIQELPTASASNEGFTYKVITAGTYAGQSARVGDVFISNGSEWVLVPAGDDFNDTWRAIKVNGTEVLNNAISSGAVNFNEGDQLTITFDAETKTLNFNVVNTYTKREVDEIIYNVLPDGTASGAIANFNTSLQLPIKSMQIDVNAKQDLHGYGYPWAGGNGKNIFNPESPIVVGFIGSNGFSTNNTRARTTYLRIKPNTTYTVSRIAGQRFVVATATVIPENGAQQTEYISRNTYSNITITSGNDDIYMWIFFYLYETDTSTEEEIFNSIQVEEGETATAWVPYENICPISGWNGIRFVQNGANIWNGITELGSFDTTTGEKVTNNNLLRSVNPIPVKPNETYMRLIDASLGFRVFYYDENMNFLSTEVSQYTQLAITIPSNCYFMNIAYQKAITSVSLNYPSTDTNFHAYNTQSTAQIINLGGNYYGGKLTQDKDGHRQFIANTMYRAIKTIPWVYNDTEFSYGYFATGNTTDKAYNTNFKCECFKSVDKTRSTLENGEIGVYNLTNASRRFVIRCDNVVSVSELNELVGDYYIIYELATPNIIDLPDGEPINTFNGINNFFADSGDATVIFKQSVNDAINAAVNAANNNRTLGMINMSKGNESEEKEETKEDLNEESNEK